MRGIPTSFVRGLLFALFSGCGARVIIDEVPDFSYPGLEVTQIEKIAPSELGTNSITTPQYLVSYRSIANVTGDLPAKDPAVALVELEELVSEAPSKVKEDALRFLENLNAPNSTISIKDAPALLDPVTLAALGEFQVYLQEHHLDPAALQVQPFGADGLQQRMDPFFWGFSALIAMGAIGGFTAGGIGLAGVFNPSCKAKWLKCYQEDEAYISACEALGDALESKKDERIGGNDHICLGTHPNQCCISWKGKVPFGLKREALLLPFYDVSVPSYPVKTA